LTRGAREVTECTCNKPPCSQQQVYLQSSAFNPGSGARIPYFLSHSWSCDATAKAIALKDFFQRQASAQRTLWFDKTCINNCDPKQSALAIATLPISVGACDKVLVVLDASYLRRLWCVWELQSVFTFCIKELAVERIALLRVGDGAVSRASFEKWTLDSSHCFDPNEEFKLRRLVHDIGLERFTASVRALADCAEYGGLQ
jgi:hypothetical protein